MKYRSHIVLISSVLSHAACNGFNYGILGALVIAQSSQFNITLTESSWTGSVHIALFLMMAPLCAVLTRLISIRKVQLAGACLTTTGIGLSGLATEHWQVVLLFGVVAGVGMALVRSASSAILTYHFDSKNVNFALSVAMMGLCFGLIVYPVMAGYLFSKFSFSYAMLMFTPLMLLHLLGVVFYSQDDEKCVITDKPTDTKLTESLGILVKSGKVWSYSLSGFFRKFAVTAFFTITKTFILETTSLDESEAAQGSMTLGCTSVVGAVLVSVTHYHQYSRLIPHAATSVSCGVVMFAITYVENQISYTMLMGVFGFLYGIQIANLMGVANEVAGHNDMVLALAFEQLMEGIGSLIGSPISSIMQEYVGEKRGIQISGAFSVIAGIITLPPIIMDIYNNRKRQSSSNSDCEKKHLLSIKQSSPEMKYKHIKQQLLESD